MRLKNISVYRSLNYTLIPAIISVILTFIGIKFYTYIIQNPCFLILPLAAYIVLVFNIIARNSATKAFESSLSVSYIDFSPNLIEFHFNRPEHDFTCPHADISKLVLDIETTTINSKPGRETLVKQLILNFIISDKTFTLYQTTSSPMKLIYNIIDHTRDIKNIEIKFSGEGEIPDIEERANTYLKTGYKDMISDVNTAKWMCASICIFGIAILILLFSSSIYPDVMHNICILKITGILLLPSAIADIFLIIDRHRDIKNNKYLANEHIFTVWHLITLKIITLIIIVSFALGHSTI